MKIIPENLRKKLHDIIYESDTRAGKIFDLFLLALIVISIAAVMLESVASIKAQYGYYLAVVEWVITIFFTIEYIARIIAVRRPFSYITSFFGITDLLATLPAYIGLLFPGLHFLLALRAVRLLRIFRILKLVHFIGASELLTTALKRSRTKISVFLFAVVVLCVILGTIMFMVEGPDNGFDNIPKSIYYSIVTLTTVGYGDVTPHTPFGQFLSMVIMILGYGIIAVPTGIVTSDLLAQKNARTNTQVCPNCNADTHRDDAIFCHHCGAKLNA